MTDDAADAADDLRPPEGVDPAALDQRALDLADPRAAGRAARRGARCRTPPRPRRGTGRGRAAGRSSPGRPRPPRSGASARPCCRSRRARRADRRGPPARRAASRPQLERDGRLDVVVLDGVQRSWARRRSRRRRAAGRPAGPAARRRRRVAPSRREPVGVQSAASRRASRSPCSERKRQNSASSSVQRRQVVGHVAVERGCSRSSGPRCRFERGVCGGVRRSRASRSGALARQVEERAARRPSPPTRPRRASTVHSTAAVEPGRLVAGRDRRQRDRLLEDRAPAEAGHPADLVRPPPRRTAACGCARRPPGRLGGRPCASYSADDVVPGRARARRAGGPDRRRAARRPGRACPTNSPLPRSTSRPRPISYGE